MWVLPKFIHCYPHRRFLLDTLDCRGEAVPDQGLALQSTAAPLGPCCSATASPAQLTASFQSPLAGRNETRGVSKAPV